MLSGRLQSGRHRVTVSGADERLAPGAGATLRSALEADDFDCGALPLYNAASLQALPDEVLSGRARLGDLGAASRLPAEIRAARIVDPPYDEADPRN